MIKLLFTSQPTLSSYVIELFTWSKYSHVDFIMTDDVHIIGSIPSKGVHIATIEDRVSNSSRYAIMSVNDIGEEYESMIESILYSQLGKKYDYLGILGYGFRKNWQDEKRWFCSELIAWACNQVGYSMVNAKKHRVSPRDLLITPYSIKIEEHLHKGIPK